MRLAARSCCRRSRRRTTGCRTSTKPPQPRAAGSRAALVRCLSVLGTCCWQWGRNDEAKRLLQQAARHAEATGDVRGAALAIHNLALVEKALGNHARAAQLMLDWIATQR